MSDQCHYFNDPSLLKITPSPKNKTKWNKRKQDTNILSKIRSWLYPIISIRSRLSYPGSYHSVNYWNNKAHHLTEVVIFNSKTLTRSWPTETKLWKVSLLSQIIQVYYSKPILFKGCMSRKVTKLKQLNCYLSACLLEMHTTIHTPHLLGKTSNMWFYLLLLQSVLGKTNK